MSSELGNFIRLASPEGGVVVINPLSVEAIVQRGETAPAEVHLASMNLRTVSISPESVAELVKRLDAS